jgi:polyphosphate kinase 2 (PPK2 family)
VLVRKFFLHVSKEEQAKRFLERLDKPEKHWKFSAADVGERSHFAAYMAAYEDMIRHTATETAPWIVVPADRKWFTRLVVSAAIIDAIQSLDPRYPEVDSSVRAEFKRLKSALEAEQKPNSAKVKKAKKAAKK